MTKIGITTLLLCIFAQKQAGGQQVHATYDKFNDTATVTTDGAYVGYGLMQVRGLYTCQGDVANCNPGAVALLFTSKTRSFEFDTSNRSVIFLVDKAKLPLGDFTWRGSAHDGGVTEWMAVTIPISQFAAIARGTNVEAQLGTVSFTLPLETMTVLREMMSGMTPPALPPKAEPKSSWCWHIDRSKC